MLSVQLSTQVFLHTFDPKNLKVNLARLAVEIATSQTFPSKQTRYLRYKEKL